MKKQRFLETLLVLFSLLILSASLSACVGESDVRSRAWIDFPMDGSEINLDSPVPITSQLYAKDGVKGFQISINGEIIKWESPPNPEETFIGVSHEWIPSQPGAYTIAVSVVDAGGTALSRAQVDITVIGEIQLLQPDLTITGVSLVDGDKIQCDYSNLGGAATPEGRDVWIDIYMGPSEAELVQTAHSNIGVDYLFEAGDSGYFTSAPLSPVPAWPQIVSCLIDVGNLVAETNEDNNDMQATLGPSVTITDTPTSTSSPISPPPPSATYIPTATWTPPPTFTPTFPPPPPPPTYTPTVPPTNTPTVPPDTTPPNISNMQASADPILPSPCQPNTVVISAQVSDASGVSEVKLYFRVVKGAQNGVWQEINMNAVGGDQYQIQIGPPLLKASMTSYAGSTLAFYVKAWDNNANIAQNNIGNIQIGFCVQ